MIVGIMVFCTGLNWPVHPVLNYASAEPVRFKSDFKKMD